MAVVASAPLVSQLSQRLDTTNFSTSLDAPLMFDNTFNEKSSLVDNMKNYLVVSPYEEKPHLLDLRTLDIPNQLLARALVGLKCLRTDYATAPYVEIFNWAQIVNNLRALASESEYEWKESSFYIVVFRSRIPPTTVYADLGVLDKAAHAEATESGGFLK